MKRGSRTSAKAAKDWREVEAQLIQHVKKKVPSPDQEWLKKAVELDAPDLAVATTEEVVGLFLEGSKLDRPQLLRTMVWQLWAKIQAGVSEPVEGYFEGLWERHIAPFYRTHRLAPELVERAELGNSEAHQVLDELGVHRIVEYGEIFRKPADWRETEKQLLELLKKRLDEDSENWKWLRKSVVWKAPDLAVATTEEILALFKSGSKLNNARLLRTLIWQSWVKIQAGVDQPVDGNVRSYWYQTVEPFYRGHMLVDDGVLPTLPPGPPGMVLRKRLGAADRVESIMTETVADFVAHKVMEYGAVFRFQPGMENMRIRGRNNPRLLFFTEKEGLLWLCQWINHEASISVMASKGEPSFVALEYFSKVLKPKAPKLIIGAFCDWDPWGYQIAEQIDAKLRFLGLKVTTYMLTSLKLFTPKQIADAHDLSKDPQYLKKKKVIDAWLTKGGGVDGKPLALHIDVIPKPYKQKLAETFVDAASEDALDRYFQKVKPVHLHPTTKEGVRRFV